MKLFQHQLLLPIIPMPMGGTGKWWAVHGAILTAECKQLLKNATPLGSEKTKVVTLKILVTKTQREKVFPFKWKRPPSHLKQTPPSQPSEKNQQLNSSLPLHSLPLWAEGVALGWCCAEAGACQDDEAMESLSCNGWLGELGLFSLREMERWSMRVLCECVNR